MTAGIRKRQLGGASSLHRTTLGKSPGARHRNFIFLVVFVLPCVKSVGFHDIDHIEGGAVFVLVIEFVERGNLPAKRWSGVAPENQYHRPLPAERGKGNRRLLVGRRQIKAGSRIAHPQPSPSRQEPERLEGKNHHRRVGNMAHHFTEQNRAPHHDERGRPKLPGKRRRRHRANMRYLRRYVIFRMAP